MKVTAKSRQKEKSAPESDQLAMLTGHQLRKAYLSAQKISADVFDDEELTSIQVAILMRLNENGETAQGPLGREASVDPTILVGLLKKLERKGLIERRRASEDLRVQHIKLTPLGSSSAVRATKRIHRADQKLTAKLNNQERMDLLNLLRKIVS